MVNYVNNNTNIKIVCPDHGIFEQTPISHLSGNKCKYCTGKAKLNTTIFAEKGKIIHNNYYSYNNAVYIDNKTKVLITCPIHGDFLQSPTCHINRKAGCPQCSKCKKYTNETFAEKGKIIHNNFYDYSLVDYINNKTNVKIICPNHGVFEQCPSSHINHRSNCPLCMSNSSRGEIEWIASFNNPNIIKPPSLKINGKTYHPDGYDTITNTVYEYNGDFYHGNPIKYNPEDINPKNKISYGQLYQETLDKKAAYEAAGYKVISIWGSEWDKRTRRK